MCMIIYRPAGAALDWSNVEIAALENPDGAGIMWARDGQLTVARSLENDRVLDWVMKVPNDVPLAVHFRFATHGTVNKDNCHPFKVVDGLYMMHNGILPVEPANKTLSDSRHFAIEYMRPTIESSPNLWKDPGFQSFVSASIGSYNKLLFMDNQGDAVIIHEKQGYWLADGCWYSAVPNSLWSRSRGWEVGKSTTSLDVVAADRRYLAKYGTGENASYDFWKDWEGMEEEEEDEDPDLPSDITTLEDEFEQRFFQERAEGMLTDEYYERQMNESYLKRIMNSDETPEETIQRARLYL